MTGTELDQLEAELLEEEDRQVMGCGVALSGSRRCGDGYLCYKCNYGDGIDPRLPKHLLIDTRS